MARDWMSIMCLMLSPLVGCGGDGGPDGDMGPSGDVLLPAPVCEKTASGGSTEVQELKLLATLFDRWHEAWQGSPAVADLDEDGTMEILVPRDQLLLGWHLDNRIVFRADTGGGRIWAGPVVADLVASVPGLEVVAASRDTVFAWDAKGALLPGFPVKWKDEMRSLAAADIDGDQAFEIVAVSTTTLAAGGKSDMLIAFHNDGSRVEGFPPNTSGAAGCDDCCYVVGGFDQNLALGDVNGDGKADILATQDNAYLSVHEGSGRAFDAAKIFIDRAKVQGVRFFLDYALSKQGWAPDEEGSNQAHFTNSAPSIADVDGDGLRDLVILGSVQNAAQTDRERGVALFAIRPDGSRLKAFEKPIHFPDYLAGLSDFEGTNVAGATNQVTAVDLFPERPGPEFVFAGFDGKIHCVDSNGAVVWSAAYTTDARVLTGGVVVADLSGDGVPEIAFNTYSPDQGKSALFILSAAGKELREVPLPARGAMPVPTIADVNGDQILEIVVSLKDGEDKKQQVLVYQVGGSSPNCVLWPTGRGNNLRNGLLP